VHRILVIADDLSGAAEIAGIGLRHGMSTRLLRSPGGDVDADLTVIDTDSRSLNSHDAREAIRRFCEPHLRRPFDLIYKKTDSAMRGQMVAEVRQLMKCFSFRRALMVPHNPSRGRTIVDGHYRIDGVPLHQTAFANDPEHPARSSDVRMILGKDVLVLKPMNSMPNDGLIVGEASSDSHVRSWAERVDRGTLPVGGADFFAAMLASKQLIASASPVQQITGNRLFVCGSASAYSRELIRGCERCNMPIFSMPKEVFIGADSSMWCAQLCADIPQHPAALIVIDHPLDPNPLTSHRLQSTLGEVVAQIVSHHRIDNLLLEGGGTASAVCRRMGWNQFHVLGELATGVVRLGVNSDRVGSIYIKPGSYPWPSVVWT